MPGLKVYADYLSQPSRVVLLFVKVNRIEHDVVHVSIPKGENRTEEYKRDVHPFGKVPAINDNGFKLFESVAIIRYLAGKFNVADHWYPRNLEDRARVDEFVEWQHIGFRVPIASYLFSKVVKPLLMGVAADEKELEGLKTRMLTALDDFENIWMTRSLFVAGDKISVADIFALCEMDQLCAISYDPTEGRPKMKKWTERVRLELSPYYEEILAPLKHFFQVKP